MPTETVMTAAEAQTRLAALDRQWNELQNAAVGRGMTPLVSAELADDVAAKWTQYRAWRDELGGITAVWSYGDELNEWTREANRVREAIVAEGKAAPPALGEWTQTGVTVALQGFGAMLALGALAFVWMNKRR